MRTRTILDADMATVGGWLRQGFSWWVSEMESVLPDWARRWGIRRWPVLEWDGGDGLFNREGENALAEVANSRVEIRIPAALCLARTLQLPKMGKADLDAWIALEADRIMPFPRDQIVLAAGASRSSRDGDDEPVPIAAISRAKFQDLLQLLQVRLIESSAITLELGKARLDFLPMAKAGGLVKRQVPAATAWWAAAGLFAVLNMSTLIWRDVDSVRQLEAIVESKRTIATAAQRAAQRSYRASQLVQETAKRRSKNEPLALLASVTTALPDQSWVQRYSWDGKSLRLSGYKRGNIDVAKVLRATGRFEDVRNVSSEALAENPSGQPFDVIISLGGGESA